MFLKNCMLQVIIAENTLQVIWQIGSKIDPKLYGHKVHFLSI